MRTSVAGETDAFQQLTDAELAALEPLGVRRAVSAGEYLYREGDAGYDFYVVLAGAVEIVVNAEGQGPRHRPPHGRPVPRRAESPDRPTRVRVGPGRRVRRSARRSARCAQATDRHGRGSERQDPRRLPRAPCDSHDRRLLGDSRHRLAVFTGLRTRPGVPGSQSHPARVAGPGRRQRRRAAAAGVRHRPAGLARRDRLGQGAAPPDSGCPGRLPRAHRRRHAGRRLRSDRGRRRPGGARGGGVRRVGRTAHAGARDGRGRWPGGFQFEDRKLPGIPDRHFRRRPHAAGHGSGPEVRRVVQQPVHGRIDSRARGPFRSSSVEWHRGSGAGRDCRERGALPEARRRRTSSGSSPAACTTPRPSWRHERVRVRLRWLREAATPPDRRPCFSPMPEVP